MIILMMICASLAVGLAIAVNRTSEVVCRCL